MQNVEFTCAVICFLQVVSDLLSPISELLTSCHLANADIAHVVLVGGTTKVHKYIDLNQCFPGGGGGGGVKLRKKKKKMISKKKILQ